MAICFYLFSLILAQMLDLSKAQSSSLLPLNGTFIITQYSDPICSDTKDIQGFIPTEKYWKIKAFDNIVYSPKEFNPNISRLIYQECTASPPSPLTCTSSESKTMSCLNECTEIKEFPSSVYYSCNFLPKSNLSLFTFTGFGDSGCNNNNGNVYAEPLSRACWTMEGAGSMSILSFIERRMTVNTYSSNNCLGAIKEYKKGFECDQSCIDNPLNDVPVYYQCKYTASSFIQIGFSVLMLCLVLLI